MSNIPTAHFGTVAKDVVDWRKETDEDPDDTELAVTPPDVVKMLGFDPAKEKKASTIADAAARIERTVSRPRQDRIKAAANRISATLARADAEFKEEDHPRAEDGKFGSKAGSRKPRISAPLAKALSKKPKEEAAFHASSEAWRYAPPVIIDAIANAKPLKSAVLAPNSGAFYMPETHSVTINRNPDLSDRAAVMVWRHEFGHAIDFAGKRPPASAACKAQMYADSARSEEIKSRYEAAMAEKFGSPDDPDYRKHDGLWLSDFVCALTNCDAGYGHSKEYFANEDFRLCEMFANYVTLSSTEKGAEFQRLLHEIAPECCKAFDDILKQKGKKWWQV